MRVLTATLALLLACGKSETKPVAVGLQPGSSSGSAKLPPPPPSKSRIEQIAPPLDIANPPLDATTTASGLIFKKLVAKDTGDIPKRNDTVVIHFTGWNQKSGETFNTTRGRDKPQPLPLNQAAPGFVEGLQLMRVGERAILWVPPAMGYVRPPTGTPETLVYEVELVEIIAAPPVPPDVAAPPATAIALPSGSKYIVLTPGTGSIARTFDTVTFTVTSWDAEGRMIERNKRPSVSPVYKETLAFEELLTKMSAGSRARFWVTADKMQVTGKAIGTPTAQLCYEVLVSKLTKGNEPPLVPAEVAAMPAGVKTSPKGVGYKILRAATKPDAKHPAPTDRIKVHYTGWTTNGRMFDSSIVRNEFGEFSLATGVIAGWTDVIPLLVVGDKARLWVPEQLAYKGAPGRPQGMLVFDLELLDILPPPPPKVSPP